MFEPAFFNQLTVVFVVLCVFFGAQGSADGAAFCFGCGVALLTLAGVLDITTVLSALLHPAVILIGSLFVITAGLQSTGALEVISSRILRNGISEQDARLRIASSVIACSMFMLNTALVAMAIPLVEKWAKKNNVPISKMLLPISYLAILGSVCTTVGTSTTILVNSLLNTTLSHYSIDPLGISDLALIGLPCVGIGSVFLVFVAPQLLVNRDTSVDTGGSPTLRRKDLSVLSGCNSRIAAIAAFVGTQIQFVLQGRIAIALAGGGALTIMESRVSPTIQEARKLRARNTKSLRIIALVLAGVFILWIVIGGTFRSGIGFASCISPVFGAALVAGLMVCTGCTCLRTAIKADHWATLLIVGASIALGTAISDCGVADNLAFFVGEWLSTSPFLMLIAVYLICIALTEICSNMAVAIVMAPLAATMAVQAGFSPRPFLVAVTLAASFSFLTPYGYQTNLLVRNAGKYRAIDFLRCGIPLTMLTAITALTLIPIVCPF